MEMIVKTKSDKGVLLITKITTVEISSQYMKEFKPLMDKSYLITLNNTANFLAAMDTETNRNLPTTAHYRPQVVPRNNTLRLAETDQS